MAQPSKNPVISEIPEINIDNNATVPRNGTASTSFPNGDAVPFLTEGILLEIIDQCHSCGNYSKLIITLGDVYSNIRSLSRSFQKTATTPIEAMQMRMGLDYTSMQRAYSALFQIPRNVIERALVEPLVTLAKNLKIELKCRNKESYTDDEIADVFLVVFETRILSSSKFLESSFPELCIAATYITVNVQAKLAHTWAGLDAKTLRRILFHLHHIIIYNVVLSQLNLVNILHDNYIVPAATRIMKILYYANIMAGTLESSGLNQKLLDDELAVQLGINILDCRKPLLGFYEFYNEALGDFFIIDHDYTNYNEGIDKFSFMRYPFILSPAIKKLGMFYVNRRRMSTDRNKSIGQTTSSKSRQSLNLDLHVRRDHIIDDALTMLDFVARTNPIELTKKLVVQFEGEKGEDDSGVSKEFFQLVSEEIVKHKFGMFTLENDSQTIWFNPTSLVEASKFTAIGIIWGLAIYNNMILSVNFPMVLYKKLKDNAGCFEDLAEWNPVLYNSLKQILEYTEDDIEDVFMQTFRVSYQDMSGSLLHHDLMKNGDQIVVSQKNKHEFAKLYADFLLNKSVEKQFQAFYKGFHMVVDETLFDLLYRPEEVELVICGRKNFDFNELENSTKYEGYTESTPIIKHFWSVVHEFTSEEQRQFLQFTTGLDRVPMGSLSKKYLKIFKNGQDTNRLPTSSTCYNVLKLPEYSSKEKLKDRLMTAIKYPKIFGLK